MNINRSARVNMDGNIEETITITRTPEEYLREAHEVYDYLMAYRGKPAAQRPPALGNKNNGKVSQ
ncbi:MAG: hypothetical protein WD750_05910 [Gammaproteobacteria bacterium]